MQSSTPDPLLTMTRKSTYSRSPSSSAINIIPCFPATLVICTDSMTSHLYRPSPRFSKMAPPTRNSPIRKKSDSRIREMTVIDLWFYRQSKMPLHNTSVKRESTILTSHLNSRRMKVWWSKSQEPSPGRTTKTPISYRPSSSPSKNEVSSSRMISWTSHPDPGNQVQTTKTQNP